MYIVFTSTNKMSILDASWDLRSSVAPPRSLCVYTAAASSQETNPFEVAAGAETPSAQAVVFGTEKGSLHYRTYPSPAESGGASASVPRPPLGVTPSGRPPPSMPRAYLPVDLAGASLPGAVVGVLRAEVAPSHRPVFLVLVDDNKVNEQIPNRKLWDYNRCFFWHFFFQQKYHQSE